MTRQMIAITSATCSETNLLVKLIKTDVACEQWCVFGLIPCDNDFRIVKLNIIMCMIGVEMLAIWNRLPTISKSH